MPTVAFWVVVAAIAFVEAAIVVAALRMRVVSDPARGVLGARATEVLWTLLPLALIAAMAAVSYQAFRDGGSDASTPAGSSEYAGGVERTFEEYQR